MGNIQKPSYYPGKIPINVSLHLFSVVFSRPSLVFLVSLRQRQLEELQVLALQFHEGLEPLGEWLSATERRLSSAEPMGTQTAKITQQITKHKVRICPMAVGRLVVQSCLVR